ncbi:MAG: type II toxin-antitoxin system PemK/MazF family toxin [Candidatus Dormibacteria bacterium]
MRRGQIWLAERTPPEPPVPVLVLSDDGEPGSAVAVAPLVPERLDARGCVAVDETDGLEAQATVDVRHLTSLERSAFVRPLGAVSARRQALVDSALCDVLGIAIPEPAVTRDDPVPQPSNGAVHSGQASAPPPPPPPPPDPAPLQIARPAPEAPPVYEALGRRDRAPAYRGTVSRDDALYEVTVPLEADELSELEPFDWSEAALGLDEHPIAQLFPQPEPAPRELAVVETPEPQRRDVHVENPTPAAAVMPELLEIVRRRLHRSAPRLEGVLVQAADEGRSVQWAAAAVRHTAVRGVMQSTLDEIAQEISAVGARRPAR